MAKEPSVAEALVAMAEAIAAIKAAPSQAADSNSSLALSKMVEYLERLDTKSTAKQDQEDLETAEARKAGRHVNGVGVYENRFPPEISFLNPLGERDHPRPELRCKMYWVGHEMRKEGLSLEEIDLLNKVQPGDYFVTGSDGAKVQFTVKAKADNAGNLDKLTFHFPTREQADKQRLMPKSVWLREVLGEAVPTASALLAEIEDLKKQLATR